MINCKFKYIKFKMSYQAQTIQLSQSDAKQLANRIFTTYDVNQSTVLEENEIAEMMVDIYR